MSRAPVPEMISGSVRHRRASRLGGRPGLKGFFFASLLLSEAAHAQPTSRLDLEWNAPAGCPESAEVASEVARLLEGAPPNNVHLIAKAAVSQKADGSWSLALRTLRDGSEGHRSLNANSCPAIADATALIIALTIDPTHVLPELPTASTPPLAPTPPLPAAPAASSAPVPSAPPSISTPVAAASVAPRPTPVPLSPPSPRVRPSEESSTRERDHPRGFRIALGASMGGDVGSLPSVAYALTGFVALVSPRFRLELDGSYWPAQTARVSLTGGSSTLGTVAAQVRLATGEALGCVTALSGGRFRFEPCAGLELGALSSTPDGLGTATPQQGLWAAAGLETRLSLRINDYFGVVCGLAMFVPLRRDVFVVDGPSGPLPFFRPSAVIARGFVGPEVQF